MSKNKGLGVRGRLERWRWWAVNVRWGRGGCWSSLPKQVTVSTTCVQGSSSSSSQPGGTPSSLLSCWPRSLSARAGVSMVKDRNRRHKRSGLIEAFLVKVPQTVSTNSTEWGLVPCHAWGAHYIIRSSSSLWFLLLSISKSHSSFLSSILHPLQHPVGFFSPHAYLYFTLSHEPGKVNTGGSVSDPNYTLLRI